MITIPSNPCLVVVIRVGCISEPEKLMSFCNNNHWLKVISSGGMLFVHYSNAKFALIFLDRDILYAPLRYPLHALKVQSDKGESIVYIHTLCTGFLGLESVDAAFPGKKSMNDRRTLLLMGLS